MNKLSREQFLAAPLGTVYLEQSTHDIGFAIKGSTSSDGSFEKSVAVPLAGGAVRMSTKLQSENDQADFLVMDEVETMACKALIFDRMKAWTIDEYQAQVLRLLETFVKLPSLQIKLPDGSLISGDGNPIPPFPEEDSSSLH